MVIPAFIPSLSPALPPAVTPRSHPESTSASNPELAPLSVNDVDRQILVHNDCWACGLRFTKDVLREGAKRHELHWHCDACDVSWTAVGDPPLTAAS